MNIDVYTDRQMFNRDVFDPANSTWLIHRKHTCGYQCGDWGIILPLGPGQPGGSWTGGDQR